jgi:hypothetical protein
MRSICVGAWSGRAVTPASQRSCVIRKPTLRCSSATQKASAWEELADDLTDPSDLYSTA